MKIRIRPQGDETWFELEIEPTEHGMIDNVSDDLMILMMAEGFVVGKADDYQWSDGDMITLEIVTEAGKEVVMDMGLRRHWTAECIGVQGING